MTGKTHCATAILVALIYQRYIGTNDTILENVALYAGVVLGSQAPDIDNMSTISEYVPPLRAPFKIIHASTNGISRWLRKRKHKRLSAMFKWLNDLFDHRGITHSIFTAFTLYSTLMITFGILIGMLTHIVTDIFFGGCKALSPLWNKRICLTEFKTGGKFETVIFSISWVVIIIMIIPSTILVSVLDQGMTVLNIVKEWIK